jgi:tRNA(fMet)-specific endonuclease VapC
VELMRGALTTVRQRYREADLSGEVLVASLIVYQELLFGAELHRRREAQHESVRRVLTDVEIHPFDEKDMASAATIRADLRVRGAPIGPYDLLIAGQALARGWTLVTANTREFARIEGLNVIDWTAPAD